MDVSPGLNVVIQQLIKKKRRQFGRKYCFHDDNFRESLEIRSEDELTSKFVILKRKDVETQCSTLLSEHEVVAKKVEAVNAGVNHLEGGWPRDISHNDLEQTIRFRKKTEKDENYSQTILRLGAIAEHGIQQNNALNVYRKYFEEIENTNRNRSNGCETLKVLKVLRDPLARGHSVSGISWSLNKKLATSYSDSTKEDINTELCNGTFVWDIGNCPVAEVTLQSPSSVVSVEFNPKDPFCVIGGCSNGQLVYWDIRKGPLALDTSLLEEGHQESVQNVLFLNSKTGTEFFSASSDGMVCWWDIRKLCRPTETLVMDPNRGIECQGGRAIGATYLEYEPTMSTKFMVGTETGTIFLCNSKAKSAQEKMAGVYAAHLGPIRALQRNPMFPKNFLTVGDWTAKIWSEDIRDSSILWTSNHITQLTSGCWSHTRPSVYLTATTNGFLQVWDLLLDLNSPTATLKVSDSSLCNIRLQDSGRILACGATDGRLALVQLGEELAMLHRNDKQLLTALFERETRREKILESRSREQKVRERNPDWSQKNSDGLSDIVKAQLTAAENDFLQSIEKDEDETKYSKDELIICNND